MLDAVQQLCPDLDAGDLMLDINAGPRPLDAFPLSDRLDEIWLTENTVGGGGIIETFLVRYGEDPRRFFNLVEAALDLSDFEIADEQLTLFLDWTVDPSDSSVRDHLAVLRQAQIESHDAYARAFDDLIRLLSQRGLFVCHSVIAALSARILKPGSTNQTDQMLDKIISDWRLSEEHLGIEIDSRMFAYLRSRDDALDQALETIAGNAFEVDRRQWRFGALSSLLWPREASFAVRGFLSIIRSRLCPIQNMIWFVTALGADQMLLSSRKRTGGHRSPQLLFATAP